MNLRRLAKSFSLATLAVFLFLSLSFLSLSCSEKKSPSFPSIKPPSSIPVTELTLIRALPIEGVAGIEPSGLILYRNTLFSISDDHDDTIYRLLLGDTCAIAEPHLRFSAPNGLLPLDFEGITIDSSGNFYLVSETEFRILRVSPNGEATWVTSSLREFGDAKGLFQKSNAHLEGIACVDSSRFILCAERSPRGLLTIDVKHFPNNSAALSCDDTPFHIAPPRVPDFADVFFESGRLYALHRAADAISLMHVQNDSATEQRAWSFHATVSKPQYLYRDNQFGHAEGFCMDSEKIYVVLDNNNDSRQADASDRRPMLFIFQRPPALARLPDSP